LLVHGTAECRFEHLGWIIGRPRLHREGVLPHSPAPEQAGLRAAKSVTYHAFSQLQIDASHCPVRLEFFIYTVASALL
jgi:hypothetical protein